MVERLKWLRRAAVACAFALSLATASSASADPSCTTTWVGPANGTWATPASWSAGSVPTASDTVCITGAEKVTVSAAAMAQSVQAANATIVVSSSSLTLSDASGVSYLGSLSMPSSSGTLAGPGTLRVVNSVALGGTISGAATVVVESTATGTVTGGTIDGATVRNEGSLTLTGSPNVVGKNGAEFDNVGTFTFNPGPCTGCSGTIGFGWTSSGGGAAPRFVNTGTFARTASGTTSATVQWGFENDGEVAIGNANVSFARGIDGATSTGSWSGSDGGGPVFTGAFSLGDGTGLAGAVGVNSSAAVVTATNVQGTGDLQIQSGSFSVTDAGVVSHLGSLSMPSSSGTLAGPGTVRVANSVALGGTINGAATVVAESTATGTVTGGTIDGATVRNDGALTLTGSPNVIGKNGAEFDNTGTFTFNPGPCVGCSGTIGFGWTSSGGGAAPRFVNTGTFARTASGTTSATVQWGFENDGEVAIGNANVSFARGIDGATSTGSWSGSDGGRPVFTGAFSLGDGTEFVGGVGLNSTAALVTATNVQGTGELQISSGSFSVSDAGVASHLASLEINSSFGTLSGPGTVRVATSAALGGTIKGSATVVVESTATGTVASGTMDGATVRNEGSLTLTGSPTIAGKNGAEFDNVGTFDFNPGPCVGCFGTIGFGWTPSGGGDEPRFVNTGTFRRTVTGTTSATVQWGFDNDGEVSVGVSDVSFTRGATGEVSTGSWSGSGGGHPVFAGVFALGAGTEFTGDIKINGTAASTLVSAERIDGATADLQILSGGLALSGSGATSHLASLEINSNYGTLSGPGTMRVAGSVALGGTISGAATVVVESTATGTVASGTMDGATVRNEGSLTLTGSPTIVGKNGAEFDNVGSFAFNPGPCVGCFGTIGFAWTPNSDAQPRFVNTGTFTRSASGTTSATVQWGFENDGEVSVGVSDVSFTRGANSAVSTGSWSGSGGGHPVFAGVFALGAGTEFTGDIKINGTAASTLVSAEHIDASTAAVQVLSGTLALSDSGATSHFSSLEINPNSGTLTGPGTARVADSVAVGGTISGAATVVVASTATGTVSSGTLDGATIRNDGSLAQTGAISFNGRNGGLIDNTGTYSLNVSCSGCSYNPGLTLPSSGVGQVPVFRNRGVLQRTVGTGQGSVYWDYENTGTIREVSGPIHFYGVPMSSAPPVEEAFGPGNAATPNVQRSCAGKPVDCATGNQYESQLDLAVGGRSLSLGVTRTYNSQLAVTQSAPGTFGYGWTGTYDDHLVVDTVQRHATVFQSDGSQTQFLLADNGAISAPAWVHATLVKHNDGTYTYTLPSQLDLTFGADGKLQRKTDRNGNALTLSYDGSGRLATVTDSASRSLTYTHNGDGTVASITDPSGLEVDYSYDDGELTGVQYDGVDDPQWEFGYDDDHQLTSMTDARGHATTTEYDSDHRVTSQTDALDRTRTWSYGTDETTITNPGGDITHETFQNGMPLTITRAQGTSAQRTTTLTYNSVFAPASSTDGTGHTTTYGYDGAGNRTSVTASGDRTTSMTYDAHRNVTSITSPMGRKTTFVYDTHGNLSSETRTLHTDGGNVDQTTSYTYNSSGDVTSITDPLNHETTLTYNTRGDLLTSTDPLGHETSWTYDDNSRTMSVTSPRGHETGADPDDFTTTFDRDPLGRLTQTTDPLGHHTSSTYDPLGNVTSDTDGEGRTTNYAYDAENQPTSVTKPGNATSSTAYDDNGQITSTTDENGHTTTYTLDAASDVTAITDPDDRTTAYTYDDAGQRVGQTDPDGRTITYSYDVRGQLTGVDYQDATTHDLGFSYNDDGQRSSMTDASGTTTFQYDSLGRLTSTTDGDNKVVGYAYDLAGRQTALTYPGDDQVTRAYDAAGQLTSITDWLSHTTTYDYDADGAPTTITYPGATDDADHWSYDRAGNVTGIELSHDGTARAGLTFTYNGTNQATAETATGAISGAHSYDYDPRGRLDTQDTTDLDYDPAGNLAAIGAISQTYDDADQLLHRTDAGGTTDYGYDQSGNRTSATPPSGPATTYNYDQAHRLTGFQHGTDPAIDYTYDADGLRATQVTGTSTVHFIWDRSTGTAGLLGDGTNRYIYDDDGLPLEQISAAGDVTYLHHDRLGSTRLTTSDDGTVQATYDYDATGRRTTTSGSTDTAFGYTGQYTDAETGLLYLRARYYDPTTGQFLTRDPLEDLTRQPYSYAGGDPANSIDPNGYCSINPFSGDSCAGNVAAGVLDGLSGGLSTKVAGSVLGFDADCASFGSGFGAGTKIGIAAGLVGGGTEILSAKGVKSALARFADETGSFSNLSLSQLRAIRSLEKQVAEHEAKLAAYRADPDKFDNLGLLRDAPTPEIRQRIIDGRIRHLENEITAFRKQISNITGD